ncbi:MAG: hypothetical protein ACOX52_20590, partial [Verrucomicrobiota bacterium]
SAAECSSPERIASTIPSKSNRGDEISCRPQPLILTASSTPLTLTGDGKGSSVAESELNELWSDGKSAIWVHIDYSRDKAQTWVQGFERTR